MAAPAVQPRSGAPGAACVPPPQGLALLAGGQRAALLLDVLLINGLLALLVGAALFIYRNQPLFRE